MPDKHSRDGQRAEESEPNQGIIVPLDLPEFEILSQCIRADESIEVQVPKTPMRLPEVPTEEEIRRFYQAVWNCRNFTDMVLIKTLFYTGVRVSELVAIRLEEVDHYLCGFVAESAQAIKRA